MDESVVSSIDIDQCVSPVVDENKIDDITHGNKPVIEEKSNVDTSLEMSQEVDTIESLREEDFEMQDEIGDDDNAVEPEDAEEVVAEAKPNPDVLEHEAESKPAVIQSDVSPASEIPPVVDATSVAVPDVAVEKLIVDEPLIEESKITTSKDNLGVAPIVKEDLKIVADTKEEPEELNQVMVAPVMKDEEVPLSEVPSQVIINSDENAMDAVQTTPSMEDKADDQSKPFVLGRLTRVVRIPKSIADLMIHVEEDGSVRLNVVQLGLSLQLDFNRIAKNAPVENWKTAEVAVSESIVPSNAPEGALIRCFNSKSPFKDAEEARLEREMKTYDYLTDFNQLDMSRNQRKKLWTRLQKDTQQFRLSTTVHDTVDKSVERYKANKRAKELGDKPSMILPAQIRPATSVAKAPGTVPIKKDSGVPVAAKPVATVNPKSPKKRAVTSDGTTGTATTTAPEAKKAKPATPANNAEKTFPKKTVHSTPANQNNGRQRTQSRWQRDGEPHVNEGKEMKKRNQEVSNDRGNNKQRGGGNVGDRGQSKRNSQNSNYGPGNYNSHQNGGNGYGNDSRRQGQWRSGRGGAHNTNNGGARRSYGNDGMSSASWGGRMDREPMPWAETPMMNRDLDRQVDAVMRRAIFDQQTAVQPVPAPVPRAQMELGGFSSSVLGSGTGGSGLLSQAFSSGGLGGYSNALDRREGFAAQASSLYGYGDSKSNTDIDISRFVEPLDSNKFSTPLGHSSFGASSVGGNYGSGRSNSPFGGNSYLGQQSMGGGLGGYSNAFDRTPARDTYGAFLDGGNSQSFRSSSPRRNNRSRR